MKSTPVPSKGFVFLDLPTKSKYICNYFQIKLLLFFYAVGDEGMRTEGDVDGKHAWLNNGYEGVSAECNWASPYVDVSCKLETIQ